MGTMVLVILLLVSRAQAFLPEVPTVNKNLIKSPTSDLHWAPADPETTTVPLHLTQLIPRRKEPWTQLFHFAEQWASTYKQMPQEACNSFSCHDITGNVPKDLKGSYYKTGPGNMERGGQRYKHFLDGDGFVTKIDFSNGSVNYSGKFVATEFFQEEMRQDKVLYRNVFGTQRVGGMLSNAFDVAIKNCANTNVIEWGGRLFALWEGGRPYELDTETLHTLKQTKDGPFQGLGHHEAGIRGVTIDNGGFVDNVLKLGKAFTAHPHVIDNGTTLVGYRAARNHLLDRLELEFIEYDKSWNECASKPVSIPHCLAPHDFLVGQDYYAFFQNPLELCSANFLLGMTNFLNLDLQKTCMLHLIPRGQTSTRGSIEFSLPTGYFNIHNVAIEQRGNSVSVVSNGWNLNDERYFPKSHSPVSFLGNWGGEYPSYEDDGGVPPAYLYKTVVDLATGDVVSHEPLIKDLVVEFPIVDERQSEIVYCGVSSTNGVALPHTGIAKINMHSKDHSIWWAGVGIFASEAVPVPKRNGDEGSWLITLLYDTNQSCTAVAVLDSQEISTGPVCRINLPFSLTNGLHSSFVPRN